uniref:Titin n=1 Tax=Steinernema glaseri TaxID=37863 RepID=A0A1I8AMD4_9BILA
DVEPSCGQEPQVDNVTVTVEFPEVVVDPEPVPSVTEEDSQKTVGPDEPLNLKEAVPTIVENSTLKDQMERRNISSASCHPVEDMIYINVTSDEEPEDALAFMASTFTTLEQATNEVTALEPRLVEKEAEPQSEENEERGADVALDQLDPVENVEPTTTTFTEDDKDVTCQSPVSPSLEQDLIESASTISDSEKAMLETEIDVFREDSDVSIDPLEEPQLVVSTELVQTEEPTEQQDLAMATSEEQDKSASVPEIAEAQADLTEVHPDQGPDEDLTDPIVFEEPECVDSTDLVEE